jgi:putative addiction module component (TIGR02574 family)
MNWSATLEQISTLSVNERIRLVQAIWDTIAEEETTYPDLTEAQKKDLDRRIAELDAKPEMALTWEEIKARVRGPS